MNNKVNPLERATSEFTPRFMPLPYGNVYFLYDKYDDPKQVAKAYSAVHWDFLQNMDRLREVTQNWDIENQWHHERFYDASWTIGQLVKDVEVSQDIHEAIKQEILSEWFMWMQGTTADEKIALQHMDYADYLKTAHWKTIRHAMLIIYGGKCTACTNHFEWDNLSNLHVHHVTYSQRGFEHLTHLKLLCADCHKQEHGLAPMPASDDLGWLTIGQKRVYARRKSTGDHEEYLRDMWEIHEGRLTYAELNKRNGIVSED